MAVLTCAHCDYAATVDADAPGLNPSCYGCQLREIARGLLFFQARTHKYRLAAYDSQLLAACGSKAKADEAHDYICTTLWPAIRDARALRNQPIKPSQRRPRTAARREEARA